MGKTTQKIEFLDSDTQDVSKTLLIAVAGTTGSGKTESALRIATGIAGTNFAVIDSENKRALNKKNRYRFHHFDMQPPYSPEAYRAAIEAAVAAGYKAIVIDSFSAEWDDEGGLSDDAADALERMSKGDAGRAEKLTMLAWKGPKMRHRSLMRFFRKLEIPIIFCLRAEPKVKFTKDDKGKTQIVDAGWLPIAEKLFGYDMLIYALMMPENPGVPVHLKKLEPEFEPMFPMGKQITEESGRLLAKWAAGDHGPQTGNQIDNLKDLAAKRVSVVEYFGEMDISPERICAAVNKEKVADLSATDIDTLKDWAKQIKAGTAIERFFPIINHADTTGDEEGDPVPDPLYDKRQEVYGKLQATLGDDPTEWADFLGNDDIETASESQLDGWLAGLK